MQSRYTRRKKKKQKHTLIILMAGKKGKKGKKGAKKKKSPDDPPSINEIVLRKILKSYELYSAQLNVKTCPDVIRALRECLEEDKTMDKVKRKLCIGDTLDRNNPCFKYVYV